MRNEYSKIQLAEIERQLSYPRGEKGIEIANSMHKNNISMTKSSIEVLSIDKGNVILEIGHGNCGHLEYLLNVNEALQYIGLEISETMHREAQKQLSSSATKNVEFKLYKGTKLPLDNESVDRVLTVNTLYFWEKPKEFLMEISRVLKKDGICIVTYAHKEFMETLPFVNDKFRLYTHKDVEALAIDAKMLLKKNYNKKEKVKSKAGATVERFYSISVLVKN